METIQMLGSLGEFLGSIAVLATLVYLTIQVRHARIESAATAMLQRTSHVLAITAGSTTSDSLAEALTLAYAHYGSTPMQSFAEGLVTEAGMTEKQAFQVAMYFGSFMNVYVIQHEVSDEAGRAINDIAIVNTLRAGLGRRFWEDFKSVPPEAFVDHVQRMLDEYDHQTEKSQ